VNDYFYRVKDQPDYLESVKKQFQMYRSIGERAMAQVPDEALMHQFNIESNSMATIVQHLRGNMLSRWTDFLTSDGEKEWRQRDAEFENNVKSRDELMQLWNAGWDCLFLTLNSLKPEDLQKEVLIRGEAHSAMEAINRQLAHYPYHIGQIVYIAKLLVTDEWNSLSIPRNKSAEFNKKMFGKS
jgi:hypothetical protein